VHDPVDLYRAVNLISVVLGEFDVEIPVIDAEDIDGDINQSIGQLGGQLD
jgi:hypothetical protein